MNKILVVCGKGASGKDTLLKTLVNDGFVPAISHTTRPMRKGETDGVEYHFIDFEEFVYRHTLREFVEMREYNTAQGAWYYGVTRDELNHKLELGNVVMILDKKGLQALLKTEYKDRVVSVYLDVDGDVRLQRYLNREDINIDVLEECVRRYKADEYDFEGIKDVVDCVITNPRNVLESAVIVHKLVD